MGISIATTSSLVNSSPTAGFSFQRGLHQRDTLSPFLFRIVAGDFNVMIRAGQKPRTVPVRPNRDKKPEKSGLSQFNRVNG